MLIARFRVRYGGADARAALAALADADGDEAGGALAGAFDDFVARAHRLVYDAMLGPARALLAGLPAAYAALGRGGDAGLGAQFQGPLAHATGVGGYLLELVQHLEPFAGGGGSAGGDGGGAAAAADDDAFDILGDDDDDDEPGPAVAAVEATGADVTFSEEELRRQQNFVKKFGAEEWAAVAALYASPSAPPAPEDRAGDDGGAAEGAQFSGMWLEAVAEGVVSLLLIKVAQIPRDTDDDADADGDGDGDGRGAVVCRQLRADLGYLCNVFDAVGAPARCLRVARALRDRCGAAGATLAAVQAELERLVTAQEETPAAAGADAAADDA